MEDHETRRKIIREWMALPKDKRQTEEQVAAFAKKAVQQNEFHRSRRDPYQKFRRDPFEKVMGWLLPRAGKSWPGGTRCRIRRCWFAGVLSRERENEENAVLLLRDRIVCSSRRFRTKKATRPMHGERARLISSSENKLEHASGTAELGSCLTDATREGRSRRAVRILAAMQSPERLRPQSTRLSDPVEAYRPPHQICEHKYSDTGLVVCQRRRHGIQCSSPSG